MTTQQTEQSDLIERVLSIAGFYEPTWVGDRGDLERLISAASKAEPQAQAGGPLVFESAAEARADREHAEKYYRQAERLLTASERTLHEAIAKRDAALDACAEALREWARVDAIGRDVNSHWESLRDLRRNRDDQHQSAIAKAQEARK